MKKIMLLLWVCFCFYLPTASAETYQNRDYNFQMEILDGWNNFGGSDEYILKRKIIEKMNGTARMGNFGLEIQRDKHFRNGTTFENLSKEQERDLADTLGQALQEKYPASTMTYSDYVRINGKKYLMLKCTFKDNDFRLTYLLGVFNQTDYNFIFVAYNDPTGQYEQQFFDMLKTLRPIIGNTGSGEWQEDIKYKVDIAEQDAIGALTSQPITITK